MCFHKWGKWTPMIHDYDAKQIQFKRCTKCGVIKDRKISWRIGLRDLEKSINAWLIKSDKDSDA